ncbi:EcsC family protein [Pseudalkalibacillus caeni]|uniref:EcsC family protein n=1 Tax=Exobacillus caeni TaxID=2574798 RepID=A0A5R9FER6_9BACL|nr:EcsC family protein [Pseudalkalibacillus caeni]TLS38065.1 EcsC family protein [Pseudalkalibacillus caeni]
MDAYMEKVDRELLAWNKKMTRKSPLLNRYAKGVQSRVNQMIPERVHQFLTTSIKNMVQAAIIGSAYTTKRQPIEGMPLEERDRFVLDKINYYKKLAMVEGAGTGAGGILLGIADFPLLLGIKMKFLFDVASVYGFNVKEFKERLYILHLFQLTFSRDEKRIEIYQKVMKWEEEAYKLPSKEDYERDIDWKAFQMEYRDYIDLPKMLQMIPGFGALVGAYVNYHFLDALGETAMNAYRRRIIEHHK